MAQVAQKTTLLDLLIRLQAEKPCRERVLVARAVRAVRSGRVVLCGILSGVSFK